MSWLGDDHLEIGVRDVAAEVFPDACVVEPGQRDPGQGCTAECEDVVRRVVQKDADMGRPTGREARAVERSEELGLLEELSMGPTALAEAKGRTESCARRRCVEARRQRSGAGRGTSANGGASEAEVRDLPGATVSGSIIRKPSKL